jgi:hypothetical protein
MSAALLAISVGDQIVKFGAYAGYASIVGLGVLSLLYFAQAREVKRLREWAGRAPERDAEVAQRVQTDAQRRVVAQPLSPATTAAQQAEAARTAAAAALYAKLPPAPPPPAPLVGPPGQLARPLAPGAAPGTIPATPATAATTAPAPDATTPAPASAPGTATAAPGSVPATPAPAPGSASGAVTPAPGSVPGATAVTPAAAAHQAAMAARTASSIGNGAGGQDTHESAAARPDPADDPPPPSGDDDDGGFSPGRTGLIIGGAVAAVLVAVVLMIALTQHDNAPRKPNELGVVTTPASAPSAGGGTSTITSAPGPAVDRRATRVAVLNGTTQTGLARTVADEVQKARFTISATETNADQTVTTTTVSYRAGNQHAAQIIAQVLGIDRASVQPVDPSASAAADADVVVIVGADKIG